MSPSISYHHHYPCFGAFYDCHPYLIIQGVYGKAGLGRGHGHGLGRGHGHGHGRGHGRLRMRIGAHVTRRERASTKKFVAMTAQSPIVIMSTAQSPIVIMSDDESGNGQR